MYTCINSILFRKHTLRNRRLFFNLLTFQTIVSIVYLKTVIIRVINNLARCILRPDKL